MNPLYSTIIGFGQTMSTNEKMEIPRVIIHVINARIISNYQNYCEENNFESYSRPTLYRILKVCAVSKQKALQHVQGLDNTTSGGMGAIDTLLKLNNLKSNTQSLEEIHLKSDDAACYNCVYLLNAIQQNNSTFPLRIKEYNFSEAQSGKDFCDSKIVSSRLHIYRLLSQRLKVKNGPDALVGSMNPLQDTQIKLIQTVSAATQSETRSIMKNKGWALKGKRTNIRFSPKVKTYLNEICFICEKTGKCPNLFALSDKLRKSCYENGERMFKMEEWLNPNQIKSNFASLVTKLKSGSISSNYITDNSVVVQSIELREIEENVEQDEKLYDAVAII
ncbi:unnamed protein product [Mytilus coruscus]|uniref:Uncharacterized protein n=1 Tax=Mytilus coruscus TaxID=42192 RepID=A0A6J8AJI4_MYTCO|nr:unnamed protein product [Mytilus coruscus]